MSNLNSVVSRSDLSIEVRRYTSPAGSKTIFIPLPRACWQPITANQCACDWCKAHPDCVPMWDTMFVSADAPTNYRNDFTSLCHYPEIANPQGIPSPNAIECTRITDEVRANLGKAKSALDDAWAHFQRVTHSK